MLEAGEAFCGSESATLRDALKRQSGRFFAAYHSANLQARTVVQTCSHACLHTRDDGHWGLVKFGGEAFTGSQ